MSDEKYPPKNKYFFASFNNDRELSLDDKTKDCVNKIPVGLVHSLHHTTRVIFTVKICIFKRSNEKKYFWKTKKKKTKKLHQNY